VETGDINVSPQRTHETSFQGDVRWSALLKADVHDEKARALELGLEARFRELAVALQRDLRQGLIEPDRLLVPSNVEVKFVCALIYAAQRLFDGLARLLREVSRAQSARVLRSTQRPYRHELAAAAAWRDFLGNCRAADGPQAIINLLSNR